MQIRKIYSYSTENLNKVCTACQLISVIQEVTKKHNKKSNVRDIDERHV